MTTMVILLVAGAVLLLLETVLPGLIAGIIGMICLISGVIMAYSDFGTRTGNAVLISVLLGLVVGAAIWVRYFPDSRVARVFVSQGTIGQVGAEKPRLLNQTGSALTALRPSGAALINGERVDVVTEGPHIDRGTPVKVVAIEGMRTVVRAI